MIYSRQLSWDSQKNEFHRIARIEVKFNSILLAIKYKFQLEIRSNNDPIKNYFPLGRRQMFFAFNRHFIYFRFASALIFFRSVLHHLGCSAVAIVISVKHLQVRFMHRLDINFIEYRQCIANIETVLLRWNGVHTLLSSTVFISSLWHEHEAKRQASGNCCNGSRT